MTTNKETEPNIYNHAINDPQIYVRRCKLEDLDAVIEINEKELPEDYPYFFYKSILDEFPESFLVAQNKNGKIIGYIMWRVEKTPSPHSLKYINKAHLVSIAVSEGYRRKGIARVLLSNSMTAIKKHKIKEYVLEVRVSNYTAIRLYEKFNYKIEGIKKNYYRDGENAYYMTLSIA
ncbi:MAG: ribosomal protein S18-alanine N-acetyltransferase [Promethearchaeota archaeon]|nr:MAG: ribosomal protein S18-alanine N-acetyltransferase [Candidatus Lokiarchaeota archaeon]